MINAIRFHLDGTVEVSEDGGHSWHPFKGIVINYALVEHQQLANEVANRTRD